MLLLFRYVFVFEEKEDMVRPAEYLLCGGVAVIDNNVVVGTLLMMMVVIMRVVLMVTIMMMMMKIAPGGVLIQTL